jgi:uncharacterized protein YdhG (YjbR/CyaY superfamily)
MGTAFSKEEKAAMRAAAAEAKAAKEGADLEAACLASIAAMSGTDQEIARAFHDLVRKHTDLRPKTWYGMPAYMNGDGEVVAFFQSAAKFKVRYATIGFQQAANLDEGNLWPTSYAVSDLTEADKEQLVTLLKRAVS